MPPKATTDAVASPEPLLTEFGFAELLAGGFTWRSIGFWCAVASPELLLTEFGFAELRLTGETSSAADGWMGPKGGPVMPYGYATDSELDESTDRVMTAGAVLMLLLVAAFPFYLLYEPGAREQARSVQHDSLVEEGSSVWAFSCGSCHGEAGEGVSAPALNSRQFLQSSSDEQARLLISVGVPGTTMSAFSQDHGGPLTSEQIRAVTTYIRSWEDEAPDRPDWRTPEVG